MNIRNIFKINIGSNRIFGLDLLRCLAILFIVIGHGNFYLPEKIKNFIDFFVFDGVSIFFVLSGFLIGGILIKEFEKKDASWKKLLNFWRRRWFRTLPNYFLILIILTSLNLAFTDGFTLRSIGSYFIFSQNLYTPHPGFFPEAWSLSVEEWFYLLIPGAILITAFVLKISKKRSLLFTAFAIIIAITGLRLQRYFTMPVFSIIDWDSVYRKQVFMRLDSLMYGVIGAYLAYYYNFIWLKYKKILFFVGFVLLVYPKFMSLNDFGSMYWCVFSFSINAVGTLLLLPYLSDMKQSQGRVYKIVTYISLISYSMYLINLSLVQTWILGNIQIENINFDVLETVKYLLYWFFTITLSILIYKYFEVPTTRLRDRIK